LTRPLQHLRNIHHYHHHHLSFCGLPFFTYPSLVGLKEHGLQLEKMVLRAFLEASSWTWVWFEAHGSWGFYWSVFLDLGMIRGSCAMILLKIWDDFNSSSFFSYMMAFTKS
jgi:hypothetical protein